MNPLLFYFREDFIELWSLDNNGRLLPVMYNSSNQLPLYFLLSGDQILMDNYAKDSYLDGTVNCFGDFWKNIDNDLVIYERFASKNTFASLLPYVLKESVLPFIIKSHFHSGNLSEFLKKSNTLLVFDSFVEENHKEIILKLFFEIIGFDPNSISSIDFFACFRDLQTKHKVLQQNDSFLLANISNGNFYFHMIGKHSPLHLAKKVLEGKGQDPQLDTVLDFLVEIAQAKGSILKHAQIKKELNNDAKIILNKFPDGLVIHTIKNNNIGVNPLKISFHKNDIEGRLNNRQSLNFIQNEFDTFRRKHNAEQLPIFLSGSIINQLVFKDFFCNTYSKVNLEDEKFDSDFILACLSKINFQDLSSGKSEKIDDTLTTPRFSVQLGETQNGKPPVPLTRVDLSTIATDLKTPKAPRTRISLPPVPSGLNTTPAIATKVSLPPAPSGEKPTIKLPELRQPPVPPVAKSPQVSSRIKSPPPPPPKLPNKFN